uniref:Uncharacterized protein n=1 Tax=Helianthus annuus TaxID=4232 RepID=A0A251RVC7_HELAN
MASQPIDTSLELRSVYICDSCFHRHVHLFHSRRHSVTSDFNRLHEQHSAIVCLILSIVGGICLEVARSYATMKF